MAQFTEERLLMHADLEGSNNIQKEVNDKNGPLGNNFGFSVLIRMSGSVTFWYGSGSCSLRLWTVTVKMQTKKLFCFLLFEGTFTSCFTDR
jgi:hypothetical protein